MPAARRKILAETPAPPEAGPLDAPAPFAVEEPRPARRRERRGPLRPEALAASRRRSSGRGLAAAFRTADAAAVAVLTWIVFDASVATGLLASPLAQGGPFLLAAVTALAALRSCRAYDFKHSETLSRHLLKVATAFALAGTAAAAGLALLAPQAALLSEAGLWTASSFVAVYLLHVWWWAVVRSWRKAGRLTPNIVVVGSTPNAARLIESALRSRDVAVLGLFDDRSTRTPDRLKGVPLLGDTAALLEHRLLPFVDRIVITVTPAAQARVRSLIAKLQVLPNPVTLLMDDEYASSPSTLRRIADAPLTYVSGHPEDESRAVHKRVLDLLVGSAALVAAAPVMALVALAVRLDSPGPILFRQRRHGFNNEEITVLKFRSMRHEAGPAGVRQVAAGDDRVTRVGRFIRRTSLDELPQLLNVLRGEMSLVGPRPHSPEMRTGDVESHRLVAEYAHRHRIKPGMTGWAAVGGSRGPVETPEQVRRRVALDVEYIERQSIWLDLYILVMTLPCLLGDRTAVR